MVARDDKQLKFACQGEQGSYEGEQEANGRLVEVLVAGGGEQECKNNLLS
jgi:hypothetical protein